MAPLDLLRPTPRPKTMAFRNAKPSFCSLLLASTVLLVGLAVALSGHLFLSALPQLCAVIRCCLLRRYMFVSVNFMVLLLVLLKLTDREGYKDESPEGGGASAGGVSPDVWFDALPSPTSFGDITTGDSESTPASSFEPVRDVMTKKGKSTPASAMEPVGDVTIQNSESTTGFSLEPAVCSPGGSAPDEYFSCPATPSKTPASSLFHPTAVVILKPPATPPIEQDDDSMDATWKAITGKAQATAHLKKSSTWDAPPPVKLEPAALGELKKSETFHEEKPAAAAAARRTVLEKRMKGREVAVAEDHDEMNRRFDAFIKMFNGQLRLQRLASLRRRRFMDMASVAGY